MKFRERYHVNPEFDFLFSSANHEEEIEKIADRISSRIVNEIELLCAERNLRQRELAEGLNTSASYITQLFRGDKRINLVFLAKIEDYFKVTFDVCPRSIMDGLSCLEIANLNHAFLSNPRKEGTWVYFKHSDDTFSPKDVPQRKMVAA